ncbi:hypothetical protein [Bacillus amyloliquefaciens]|uniref:Spore coat protein n=1 Tax=Bacillus amyloliquefaciens TaxID=1390 RepID=A0AAP7TA00_BACAM|nr:hypothetical protein [Bacillus amyloliquefaciens]OIK19732.1 hypothetical protein BKP66_15480 [Bacillus amyloliquefaciens]
MARALHELLEIQEMTSFKSLCLTKSKTMKALVSDPQLKEIMQQDVDTSTRQLQEFASILSDSQHE